MIINLDNLPVDKTIINYIKNQSGILIDGCSFRGGNSVIFFGEHKVLKKRVALKFYYILNIETAHREAQILSCINHDNILEVYDAKIIGNNYAFFLTPEIKGGDLDNLMTGGIVSVFSAINIIRGILKGLTALHEKKRRLVHCDLKPGNILLDSTNRNSIIADFGSFKIIPDDQDSVAGSRHTFIYRPPESIKSNKFYLNSDIYQVGVIFYQLLGGYFPYSDIAWLNEKQKNKYILINHDFDKTKFFNNIVGNKICCGKLLKFETLPIFICHRLKNIIKRATHVNFKERYQAISEFLKDIHSFMSNAVDWWEDNDIIYAAKQGKFLFKITKEKGKLKVLRKYGKKWKSYNKIKGSLREIVQQISVFKT